MIVSGLKKRSKIEEGIVYQHPNEVTCGKSGVY